MPIEISMYFGAERSKAFLTQMTDDLIAMVRKLEAIVLQNEASSGQFFALANGIIINAYGVPADMHSRIVQELKPIHASVHRGKGYVHPDKGRYEIGLRWLEVDKLEQLPGDLADAMRTDPSYAECPHCHTDVKLALGVAFCPHCAEPLQSHEWDSGLTVCVNCKADPEGGSVFHHSYDYCPRCGKRLKRLPGHHWFDYVDVDEVQFTGGGIPVNELDLGEDVLGQSETSKRPRRKH
jgi:hypothetical protein